MQTILLIRHAIAKDREDWSGADELRPLTKAGQSQAVRIAKKLGSMTIDSIRSSPAVRCVQTVEPLAARTGVAIERDPKLMEGSPIALPAPGRGGTFVYCAHGDNIPALLESLGLAGEPCKKGSIWTLQRNKAGEITHAVYAPP